MADDLDPYANPVPMARNDVRKWRDGEPPKRFIVEPGKLAVPVDPPVLCGMLRAGGPCGRIATARIDVKTGATSLAAPDSPACIECITALRRDCGDFITITERPLDTPF